VPATPQPINHSRMCSTPHKAPGESSPDVEDDLSQSLSPVSVMNVY
jgi:hypothetical protein